MLNEKASDDPNWINKLADLEGLPNESFNKDEVWMKLHERMLEKSRDKKAIWYWAAAACLLVVLIVPWLFPVNKKTGIVVKNNFVHQQTQSAISQLLPTVKQEVSKDTVAVISLRSSKKKLTSLRFEKSNPMQYVSKHTMIPSKDIRDKKEKEDFSTPHLTINAAAPVDTVISIVSNIPEKKKLKVVHINELGDPVTELPNIVKSREHRSMIKFINQEVNTSLPSSGNTGFNMFTTKKIPSN
ncbi:MAG: hypothetical protein ABI416_01445 [Ginsengibacter sp.]